MSRPVIQTAVSSRRLRHRKGERGQAMLEYSLITHFFMLAGGVSALIILPSMMNALNNYLQNIYFMLNLALP